MSDLIVSTSVICAFFEVSPRTPLNWKQSGCPCERHGRWDLKAVFDWWQNNIMVSASEEKNKALAAIKLDYWRDKARNERLRADKTEEELISKDEVAKQWAMRLSEVANGLAALSMRLPPLLEGKSQSGMRAIIDSEQKKIRGNYYRTGRFCIPPEKKEPAKRKASSKKAKKKAKRAT